MIVVKIKAGLGNQMFQYAIGRRLSYDWHDELKFDLSWFFNIKGNETPRNLELDKFDVSLNKATDDEIKRSMNNVVTRTITKMIDAVLGRLDRNHFYRFYPRMLKKKSAIYLNGYFQNFRYFDSIKGILLKEFVLKDNYSEEAKKIKDDISLPGESVAIHVRRGDFVTTCKDWNGLCGVEYYEKGLAEIRKKYKDIRLYVFSDDIGWAQENLKFDFPKVFVSRPSLNSAEELLLMSSCKHQIIANSSFSWWAAWLNQNSQKIVVAPTRWLLAADIDTKELLPKEWLRL